MFGVLTAFINLITEIIGGAFRLIGGCLGSIALVVILTLAVAALALGHVL